MPLQQLVEYFNDRLELEYNNGFRPFQLHHGAVRGLFGPISLNSYLAPLRETDHTTEIVGYAAQLQVLAQAAPPLQSNELENVLQFPSAEINHGDPDSVIHFDRLLRTVHMLNYLPQAHLGGLLSLDVDPRHILGVKADHGAYFEEIIVKCGLQTNNVAIALTINHVYSRFYSTLLKGLENYQKRGYRIFLKVDLNALTETIDKLINRTAPDFVGIDVQQVDRKHDAHLSKIQQLNSLVRSNGGRSVLLNVGDKEDAGLARQGGFDWLQGEYYEQPITSVRSRSA
jgi:EAL domain-containing protein (putative c-di-GMP-specific phosphodiesterase class I)